jgi:hypothetical protein
MQRPLRRQLALVATGFIAALATTSIDAQTNSTAEVHTSEAGSPAENLLTNRFVVSLGGFAVISNVNGSLSGSASTSEQKIDFDKRFGTDADQTRLRAEVLWRITPRQHLRFSYFNNDVKHTRTLDQDLAWGDYTFLAGAQATAEIKWKVYELDYEFAFLRRANYEIVVLVGIHLDDLALKLSGNASLTTDTPTGPVEQTATFTTTSNSVTAPLPVLGVRGDWAVSPHICLEASAEVFSLSYQGISGNWSDLRAGATWMFNNHFGIGAGYERFALHADLSKLSFTGRLNTGYQGLLIYVKGSF